MAGFLDFLRNNNAALLQTGLGLLGGRTGQEQAALGAQGLAGALEQNRTMQYLERANPALAADVRAGMPISEAWRTLTAERLQAQKPKNSFMAAGGSIYNTDTGEWLTPPNQKGTDRQGLVNAGGGKIYDPNTAQWITAPGSDQPAPANFDDVSGLRKEIQQLPSYKNLSQALPIYRSMSETAGRNTKASDLNLVYGLGKIMDPTSVVREGEMIMVKNTASLPDWLQGAIASLNGGAALTPETRQAIMTEAYGRVQGYDQAFKQDAGMYRGIVERNRMNSADVIPDFGQYEAPKAQGSPTAAPQGVPSDVWNEMTDEEKRLWQR